MWIAFFITSLVIIDQLLKAFVIKRIKFNKSIVLIPKLLEITYVENRGAAFGIFQNQRIIFIIFTIIMILFFIYLIFYKKINDKIFLISATLIMSGGIGNLIDRIFLGYVVDYIKLSFFSPVCNFADYCISFGSVILFFYIMFCYKKDVKFRS